MYSLNLSPKALITEKLRFSPPDHCEVYILKDGIAVFAKSFPPSDFSLKLVAQQRFRENLVTVFRQGDLQISIETSKGFFVAPLSPCFEPCKIFWEHGLFFVEGQGALAVFNAAGECVLNEKISEYRIENDVLSAVLPLSDSRGRFAECAWALTDDACFQTSFKVRQTDTGKDEETLRDELIPYAFFESVLIGADFSELLSDELKERAQHIKAFLGDFVSVVLTEQPNTCGLVRKKKERLFEVHYFTAEVKDGKIVDIRG